MTTFVVSHVAPLVSYLTAVSLKLRYGRLTRLHVIEHYRGPETQRSTIWCGVSTLSHERINEWEFLLLAVLGGVLREALLFVDSIHIKDPLRQPNWTVESEKPNIRASESKIGKGFGIFYRPDVVLAALRLFLESSPNVSFSSMRGPLQPRDLESFKFSYGLDCIFVIFEQERCARPSHYTVPRSHGICTVNIESSSQYFNNHETKEICLPHTIWFPMYRAAAGLFTEALFVHSIEATQKLCVIHISSLTQVIDAATICTYLDLLWGLRACGYALQCVLRLGPSTATTRL